MRRVFIFLFSFFSAVYVFAQEQNSNIKSLLSAEGKVLYGNEQNSLVVIDYPENVERVKEY